MPSFSADNNSDKLPTYRQWRKANRDKLPSVFPVERILWSDDWKSYTAFTEEFRYSWKFEKQEDYLKAFAQLKKILTNPCRCYVQASEEASQFIFEKASDADESPDKYTEEDWGFIRNSRK